MRVPRVVVGARREGDLAVGRSSRGARGGGAGYNETYEQWFPATVDAWTIVGLSAFEGPANAVVEMALTNGNPSFARWVGMPAVGSSLDRRIQLHEAKAGGEDVAVMHVQADDRSRIEYHADTASTEVRFTVPVPPR